MAIQAQFPLCGWQDWMDNGCGGLNPFHFNAQQQKQQRQQQQQQPLLQQQQLLNQQLGHQNLCFDNSLIASSTLKNSNNLPSAEDYSHQQSMSACCERQRQELDHYIRLQNERLRLLLQEQRKQHLAILVKRIESKAMPLLTQKDEEIARATKRTMELEDLLRRLEMENQVWQRVAQENEAMVVSLNNTIEQVREKASTCFNANNNNIAEDAESCCCDMNRGLETEQRNRGLAFDNNNDQNIIIKEDDHHQDRDDTRERMMMTMMIVCKGCNSRNACVLFLPCRHLSSCKACEAFLESCPVCQTPKKASIEALMV